MNRYLSTILCICAAFTLSQTAYAQAPTASFTASKTSGCSPIVVNFTDNSTGSPTSWSWDLGNGVTSSTQNPSTTYFTAGTYTVILTATNANGSSKDTNYITVHPSPTISFTGDSTISCPPKTVAFTNNTTTGGTSATYLWDFGDGDTSSLVSPTHIYTNSGNFNVSLIVSNNLGCTSTFTKNNYVKTYGLPVPNFTVSNTSSCTTPLNTTFTNTSTGASSYYWDFGDGSNSTATSPSHTFTSAGSYTVKLVAINANGCNDTSIKSSVVNVGTLNASFTKSTSTPCTGQNVTFTNTTTPGAGNSTWFFGDGTSANSTNAVHRYNTAGTYTVTLIESFSNCSDTTTQTVTVLQSPTAQFTTVDTVGCGTAFSVSFTNSSTNANTYSWTFGDGSSSTATNPTHTYTALGVYDVRLVATSSNGCSRAIRKNDLVKNLKPTGSLVARSFNGCAPIQVTFDAEIDSPLYATGYTWNYGDGTGNTTCSNCATTQHTFTNAGTYNVSVICSTSASCFDTFQTTVTVGTVPSANFTGTPLAICTSDNVTFTNTSTGANGYQWLFGDGTISTLTNPLKNYSIANTYSVSLIAINNGCRDTFTRTNYITVSGPTAGFGISYNCTNRRTVTFTDASLNGQIYLWDFGDGDTSTFAGTVTHTYATAGTYSTSVKVTDTVSGCIDIYQYTFSIYDLAASFSVNDSLICIGDTVSFAATSSSAIVNYLWSFGDGANATLTTSNTTHPYSAGGYYTVRLIVTDKDQCKDTVTKTNYIRVGGASPIYSGTPTSGCVPLNVTFTDASVPNGGFPITTREWSYGDGSALDTIVGNSTSNLYSASGSYHVKLTLIDANGCKTALTKLSYINTTKPTASFAALDSVMCIGDSISFTNTSSDVSSSLTYSWDFGDGATSTLTNPKHAYASAGSYTIRLIAITANGGCRDTMIRSAYIVIEKPTAAFTMSDTVASCPPATVYLTNNTTGASSYAWTFGNNTNSSLTNPTAVYTYPGTYPIKVVATSSNGCTDSISKNMVVYGPTGTFSYTAPTGCNPLTVNFSATSSNTSTYIWDMSNGFTHSSTGNTFSYTYTQGGSYIPKLILSDGSNCLVPITGADTINVDHVDADFTFSNTTLCDSGTVYFNDTVYSTISSINTRTWDFGDGSSSTAEDPNHTYTSSGSYTVKLIIGNTVGCKDTIIKTVVIHASPNVLVTPATSSKCLGDNTGIVLTATGASTYSWTPNSTLSCSNCPNPTANPAAATAYIVTGTDTNGCSSKDTAVITVYTQPTVSAGSNQNLCAGSTLQLTATGATSYTWSPSTGLSCTNCASPFANPTTTTTYTTIGTDANGCKDTSDVTITILSKPTVSAGSNKTICIGSSTTLTATGATSYTWSPSTGLSCTTCPSPTASPTTTTVYTVVGTAGNGCTDTATVTVTVNPLPIVSAGSDKAICSGSSTILQATGATSYTWTPSTGLSCTNCPNPTASPTTTTTYTVTGTDGNGCVNTDQVVVTVNALPNVIASANTSICLNDSTQLTATGANTYVWTPSTGLSCTTCANPYAKPTITTTYTVTGTDINGCVNSDAVTVTVNPLPNIDAGTDKTICNGSSVTLLATGGNTYTWTPSTGLSCTACTNPIASPTTTTTYIVTGTDTNGCANKDSVKVTVNPLPNVNAGNDVSICVGSSTNLSATGAITYTWSPSTGLSCTSCASPTANPTSTTTYVVTGVDANGCVNTDTVVVTVNPLPTVNAGNDVAICFGSSTILSATGATSYVWTPSTGLSCTTCANTSANPTSTTTYVVTGTDANGCVNTDTVVITVKPLPNIQAGNDVAICIGDTTQLQGSGAVTYSWTPSTGLSCTTCPDPKAYPTVTTTYILTGTSTNNCTNVDSVIVTVNPLPTITINGGKNICKGNSTQLTAVGAQTYTWSPTNGLSCTNCTSPIATPADTTIYIITGTDANGCVNTTQVKIDVKPVPVVTSSSNTILCYGDSVQLTAGGATSYIWSPSNGLSCTNCSSPVAKPTLSVTYLVTGTTNGCSDTNTVTVNVLQKPTVTAGPDIEICKGNSDTLKVTGANSYSWSPNAGLSCNNCQFPITTTNVDRTYIVTGTDLNGCKDTSKVFVKVHNSPNVDAGPNKTICNGESTQLTATGATSYTWSPTATLSCTSCTSPYATPITNTTYQVIGVDMNGCSDSDKVTISVKVKSATSVGKGDTLCYGATTEIAAYGGNSYEWSPSLGLLDPTADKTKAAPLTSTNYRVIIKQQDCYTDTGYVFVQVNPNPEIELGDNQHIKGNGGVQLDASGNENSTYIWTPVTNLSCTDCATPKATPTKTTTYNVKVTNAFGCETEDNITIFVTCNNDQVFIANTFTPNGDGLNDKFYPQGKGIAEVKSMRIYNRWGEVVFSQTNMPLNDPNYGWDGTYNRKPLKPDVFIYVINATCDTGEPLQIRGDISLVR
ncbi:MAG: PKD domain-containing protein [Flavipsychrobacter sp.]